MNWEVKRLHAGNWMPEPSVPEGWEPFGIQVIGNGVSIWLKKEVVPAKVGEAPDVSNP